MHENLRVSARRAPSSLKVLVVAYSYNRHGKSESLVSYELCNALRGAFGHELTVLTRYGGAEPNVVSLGEPKQANRHSVRSIGKAHKLGYYRFIRSCAGWIRDRYRDFDLIHQISPISLRYPSPLATLPLPFIWGPVGGSIPYPPGFARIARREGWLAKLRAFDAIRMDLDPLMRSTLRHSRFIAVTSKAAGMLLPARYRDKVVHVPEGISRAQIAAEPSAPGSYIFGSGRLVPYKAFDLLIRAYGKIGAQIEPDLWITGDGPERDRLKRLVDTLGLGARVRLMGRVDRGTNLKLMRESLFCVFPALTEAFGGVNLEALANAKAVIATNWGGPGDILTDGFDGYKIDPRGEGSYVDALSERMLYLVNHPSVRARMEQNALSTARKFAWDEVASRYHELYLACLEGIRREF